MQTVRTYFPLVLSHSTPPDNLSIQEFQKNEAVDVEVISSDGRSTWPNITVMKPTIPELLLINAIF